jgi:uncharacterized protein (DUF1684 family)
MTVIDTGTFAQEWAAWHEQHETVRADRHGFLAITGLHWLTAEPQRVPGAPGEWWTGPDGVVVRLAEDESLLVDGLPVHGERSPVTRSSRWPSAAARTSSGRGTRTRRCWPPTPGRRPTSPTSAGG